VTDARLVRGAVVALTAALVASLAACTSDHVDPARAGTVVVAVDTPFVSLNAGLPDGRTAGSTLVRGLVQDGLVGLDDTGTAVPDRAFGTVEKVSDSPLTVRYTLAPGARWSDGVPVSPADLLLEWAARSGRFDEVVPGPASPATSGAPTPTASPSADGAVRFGATSAAVLEASATPTLDEHGMTLVYDHPVADWQVDLDVDLPAHVVGRLALAGAPTPGATAPAPEPSAAGPAWADDGWARAVADAIVQGDRTTLARVSQVWRTGFGAAALAADPARAVTTGPYRIESVDPAGRVTLVRSGGYAGPRPGTHDRVVVRWDLDPLAAVDALRTGAVDVVAPVVTPDVTAALGKVPGVRVRTGGGAVLQLQLNEASGPFAVASGGGDAAVAAAGRARAAFLAAAPRSGSGTAGVEPSDAVLATVGAGRTTSPAASSGAPLPAVTGSTAVRVLVATGDPVRASLLAALTSAASSAGFAVTAATPADASTALWSDPGSWDAALVPVTQAELPVAGLVDRWRTGGATDVTGHADAALDALLDRLAGTADPAAAGALLDRVGTTLRDAQVVVPLVRQPSLTATVARAAGSGLPDVGEVGAVPWGAADLSSWWSWTRQQP
jgi:peptide/nickel transport system substrate-binding protein